MKNIFLFAICFCLACTQQEQELIPQSFNYNTDISDAFDIERLQRIDKAFEEMIEKGELPHAVTFVAHKGRVVHYKAYGWKSIEEQIPCNKTDIFRIASQTKAIAVVALMTLFEEGKFQIDEPIKKYIPAFGDQQVLESYHAETGAYTSRKAKREITIRHLITHTSGISYTDVHWNIAMQAGVPPLNSLDSITLEQMVNRIARLPLAHDPGEKFTYSMNIEVLGRLAEIISGKDIYTFIKERVLDPLGMNDTYFYLPQEKENRLVKLYEYTSGKELRLNKSELYQTFPISGAKMLYSTGAGLSGPIEDYAKFCQMILNDGEFNGKRILGRKTLEMMKKNAVKDYRGEIGFGMAWDVFRPENAHNTIVSEGSMRWGGMFGTDYIIDPTENLILLVYTNTQPNRNSISPKILMHNLVYQALK